MANYMQEGLGALAEPRRRRRHLPSCRAAGPVGRRLVYRSAVRSGQRAAPLASLGTEPNPKPPLSSRDGLELEQNGRRARAMLGRRDSVSASTIKLQ